MQLSGRNSKILKILGVGGLASVGLVTLFLNCSGGEFTAAGISSEYAPQGYSIDIAINAQPATSSVMIGNSFTISVNATGGSTLYYQWYKDGTAIPDASSSSYTIASVTNADAGAYCVIIWDSTGSVISSNGTLTTIANPNAPSISAQPTNAIGSVGGSANFSITASSTSGTISYQWYQNGSAILGATSANYSIASIASSDAGSYYVVMTNSVTSVTSNTVTLSIVAAI